MGSIRIYLPMHRNPRQARFPTQVTILYSEIVSVFIASEVRNRMWFDRVMPCPKGGDVDDRLTMSRCYSKNDDTNEGTTITQQTEEIQLADPSMFSTTTWQIPKYECMRTKTAKRNHEAQKKVVRFHCAFCPSVTRSKDRSKNSIMVVDYVGGTR